MKNDHPLTQEEFDQIYSKVPRLTVEIIIKNGSGGVLLSKRAIEPCKDQWHLPGGTVRFGESLVAAVKRIAQRELGVEVISMRSVGHIEYPSHYQHGLDHPVGMVFEVQSYEGDVVLNEEANEFQWCSELPDEMHADQDIFLPANNYLAR